MMIRKGNDMKALTALVGGLALLLVFAAVSPSTTSAATIDPVRQDVPAPELLQQGTQFEDCWGVYDNQDNWIEVCELFCPGDELPLLPSMVVAVDDLGEDVGPNQQNRDRGQPDLIPDPCRPWIPPCDFYPFGCTQPEDPEPTPEPVLLDICYQGVFYPGANVAGVDPSIYTIGECPVDQEEEPTPEPTSEPTEEPTEPAPPPAETGNAGMLAGTSGTAWAVSALTLLLSGALGAGALAVRRR